MKLDLRDLSFWLLGFFMGVFGTGALVTIAMFAAARRKEEKH